MAYVVKYGARWPDTTDPLEIEFDCIRWGGKWKHPKTGEECGAGLFEHFMNARKLIWPHRYRHRWTELMYQNFIENDLTVLVGAASCVAGHTRLLNPSTGKHERIDDLCAKNVQPMVMTLDGPELADAPFVRGYADLYEITLANGIQFTATAKHRVLSPDGFVTVGSLCVGMPLLAYGECRPRSNLDSAPSAPCEDDRNYGRTIPSSRSDYRSDCHSCDERLPLESSTFQDAFPLQACARKHNQCICCAGDDPNSEYEYTHEGLSIFPRSSSSGFPLLYIKENACPFHALSRIGEHAFPLFQQPSPFQPKMHRHHSSERFFQHCERTHCFCAGLSLEISRRTFSTPSLHSQYQSQIRKLSFPNRDRINRKRAFSGSDVFDVQNNVVSYDFSIATTQIVSIRYAGKDFYYDLEVPKAHHYFAEGTIHHNTQKTSHAVEFCLLNYWARPDNTLVVLSTVNMEKLDIGVWAELKMLWNEGRNRYDWLAGNIIEHKRAITTESLEEDGVRDFRKGIIARPCYVGGRWVGLGILAGTKQDYLIYLCDELQFMAEAFSGSWPHLFSNGQAKIIGSGNPKHDPDDELSKTAEPPGGWNSHPEPEKTEVWPTKFMGGKCINLVGTDSPNFDVPEGVTPPYPRLINRSFAKRIAHDHGEGSFEYYRLVKGVMKVAFAHSRVITRQLCRDHHALDQVKWKDDIQTHIYALDPSYGGEDRCVGMPGRFGLDIDGVQILELLPYRVFKLDLRRELAVEDQIAKILQEELDTYEVVPENCFYDACGKGTIGAALARKFGHRVPVAVDSGARPTKRPVREDLFIEETVHGVSSKRLKRCDEHYSKFVSEMWFSVRYAIEAGQVRGLLEDVMSEGCARVYEIVMGNKFEVEPKTDPKKKEDLKRRLGKSPDLFDCAVILTEGARQRGFKIKRLGVTQDDGDNGFSWLKDKVRKHDELMRSKQLEYA